MFVFVRVFFVLDDTCQRILVGFIYFNYLFNQSLVDNINSVAMSPLFILVFFFPRTVPAFTLYPDKTKALLLFSNRRLVA